MLTSLGDGVNLDAKEVEFRAEVPSTSALFEASTVMVSDNNVFEESAICIFVVEVKDPEWRSSDEATTVAMEL
jgi:hypothetical protein